MRGNQVGGAMQSWWFTKLLCASQQWWQQQRQKSRRKRHRQRETDVFILFHLEKWHQCWTLMHSYLHFVNRLRTASPRENFLWNLAIFIAVQGYENLSLFRTSNWSHKPSPDQRRLLSDVVSGYWPLLWRFPIWPHDPLLIAVFRSHIESW